MRIKRRLQTLHRLMVLWGLDPYKTLKTARGLPFYFRDLWSYWRQHRETGSASFPFGKLYPCLEDKFAGGGAARGHYFYQDLLVARRVFLNNPKIHVDVGSRVDGFVAHVAAFRFIEVLDIRPLDAVIPNVRFLQVDMMGSLPQSLYNYCDSLSCLHALEHFGLGRYGDRVRFDGHEVGFHNLSAMLKPAGKLYLSVPIGPPRVEFNGHRVFSIQYLVDLLRNKFRIDIFSFLDDAGRLFANAELTKNAIENNCGCEFGCGVFELTKTH